VAGYYTTTFNGDCPGIVLRSRGDEKGGMVSAPKMDEVVYVYNFSLEKGSEADFASDCIRTAQKDLGKLR
jgi:hypothetical protein